MSKMYSELFIFPFTGTASTLLTKISEINGIDGVTLGTQNEEIDSEVQCEITYDAHTTDRTRIAQHIEAINGTGFVVFG